MKTRIRTASVAVAVLAIGLSAATAGCGKYSFNNLKAMKAFKEANDHYRASRWREAADRYEAVIAANPNTDAAPDFLAAYFFLGNSYDNLWKPARKGEPENDALMTKAIENYTKGAELSKDPLIKRRSMEYIVAAYAPDKLNDPSQAEPIVQKMIQMDPNEPTAYFQLSKIYEDAGRYEEAEAALLKARDARPTDPTVWNSVAGYYNRQGEFEKTMEAFNKAAELDPNNPQGYHLIGSYYQEKASKDFRLTPAAEGSSCNAQGHRGRGQGAGAQPELHRGAGLQEHPAPAAGAPREGSGQAEGTAQPGRPAPQQGDGPPEGWRGRQPGAKPAPRRPRRASRPGAFGCPASLLYGVTPNSNPNFQASLRTTAEAANRPSRALRHLLTGIVGSWELEVGS